MKIETIREMTPAELSSELLEVKKDIARVKTVIKEKELEAQA